MGGIGVNIFDDVEQGGLCGERTQKLPKYIDPNEFYESVLVLCVYVPFLGGP